MDDKGSSFEDIVDAYLAYLQVSFLVNSKFGFKLFICVEMKTPTLELI